MKGEERFAFPGSVEIRAGIEDVAEAADVCSEAVLVHINGRTLSAGAWAGLNAIVHALWDVGYATVGREGYTSEEGERKIVGYHYPEIAKAALPFLEAVSGVAARRNEREKIVATIRDEGRWATKQDFAAQLLALKVADEMDGDNNSCRKTMLRELVADTVARILCAIGEEGDPVDE